MLISAVQQSDSVIHVYSFSYSFPLWFITGDWITYTRKGFLKEYIDTHIYVCITELLCCTPEANTTLWINYISIKNFKNWIKKLIIKCTMF